MAAQIGCVGAAGYAVLKAAWGLGSTIGVRADRAQWERFVDDVGGPLLAAWGTVLLALLAAALLQSLVRPWGRCASRRLRASLAWLGFTVMSAAGLSGLFGTVADMLAGRAFPVLAPGIYLWTYACFTVLGIAFAVTAWRTRDRTRRCDAAQMRSRAGLDGG